MVKGEKIERVKEREQRLYTHTHTYIQIDR